MKSNAYKEHTGKSVDFLLENVINIFYNFYSTVGENIIANIKMQNNFCYPLKMLFFFNIAIV